MAYLSQPSSQIPNAMGFTYIGWVRVPAPVARFSILQWGDLNSGGIGISYIDLLTVSGGDARIDNNFVSAPYDAGGGTNGKDVVFGGFPIGTSTWWGQWHLIMIGFLGQGGLTPFTTRTRKIVIDGVTKSTTSSLSQQITNSPIALPGICVNGFEIGMPFRADCAAVFNPALTKIEFGDIQIWFGTYIDPTVPANFAKFATVTGGKGYPVDPSVAAAAFGQQQILFHGVASDGSFFVNGGNGGAFQKVGVPVDFPLAPSYVA